ncbi:HAD-superfamily hydrolase [Xylariomycetidae sp. FL0641]|nr:HAD-superfamily hydrolase [Xylariomycetidae sp. FL0641]
MASPVSPKIAFAFDIDGVLVKGKEPLPTARKAIETLLARRIPFIFLTNGGGLTEAAHADRVKQRLGLEGSALGAAHFVQSHTPFHGLVETYSQRPVLVLGGKGHQIRDLAGAYGFRRVITSSDLQARRDTTHPFPELTGGHHLAHSRPVADADAEQIAAILIWSSPRDWCLDLQVIVDLLLGRHGGEPPKLFFCNPDIEWATHHDWPRLAQGAFREALRGIWTAATGGERGPLQYTLFGKPTEATYGYAERALQALVDGNDGSIDTVYMVGDNPQSDIVGANSFESRCGYRWKSVLVETGVHVAGTEPAYPPYHTARNVGEAVQWALNNESVGIRRSHKPSLQLQCPPENRDRSGSDEPEVPSIYSTPLPRLSDEDTSDSVSESACSQGR